MSRTITIRLTGEDESLKDMISDLKEASTKDNSNPYYKRSESEIAKMLIKEPIKSAHRLLQKNKNKRG